ncbi:hypothetical protein CONPUDRAFT_155458 [Coniophora puteana RWD-64-598 SS2]|uniref:Uncharacterized protein n=1 Tax=Coniophora puteana (strain RWD-64-598) TaxID=741705 RepID=A0A5M3MM45_CONPW|nr:uncharacterized protein CONPUDRAFT_155458 [Coniophora puteana RWD-64-598 SS2]EIW80090.1 hypothetical protein CONPUDRAFT_155458 [Coniophora puteana RWD-64-598 SS2]
MSGERAIRQKIEALRKDGLEAFHHDPPLRSHRQSISEQSTQKSEYWEYRAMGAPKADLGEQGDVYIDLLENLLYAKLAGGWTEWPGVTSPSGALNRNFITHGHFRRWLLLHPGDNDDDELPYHYSRYLWCNVKGVYWWTENEIEEDRFKLREFPPETWLRSNGKWIVRDFLKCNPHGLASKSNTSSGSRRRTRDDTIITQGNASIHATTGAASANIGTANKRPRVERSSEPGTSQSSVAEPEDSLDHISSCIEQLKSQLQAQKEASEDAAALRQRLAAVESELKKAQSDVGFYKAGYFRRGKRLGSLRTDLRKAKDSAEEHQKRYTNMVNVQKQAMQLLKTES